MKTFDVIVTRVQQYNFKVEAETIDEAQEKAEKELSTNVGEDEWQEDNDPQFSVEVAPSDDDDLRSSTA